MYAIARYSLSFSVLPNCSWPWSRAFSPIASAISLIRRSRRSQWALVMAACRFFLPAQSAIDSSCALGSGMVSRVREVIAIALRVASRASPAQAASAGLNPSVTLAGVPRCPLAANTAVEMAIAKTPPRRCR